MVHRDLKPLNILVNGNFADVAIADFGLPSSCTSGLSCSRVHAGGGGGGGTVPYMAPEQHDDEVRSAAAISFCRLVFSQLLLI